MTNGTNNIVMTNDNDCFRFEITMERHIAHHAIVHRAYIVIMEADIGSPW